MRYSVVLGFVSKLRKGREESAHAQRELPPPPEWLFTNLDQLYMSQLDSSLRIVHKVVVR